MDRIDRSAFDSGACYIFGHFASASGFVLATSPFPIPRTPPVSRDMT